MNRIKLFIMLSALGLSACIHQSTQSTMDGSPVKVSRDYEAIGDARGIHPYIYGRYTVIKFDANAPSSMVITDDQGAEVKYKSQAGYYMLERKLDTFTLNASGRQATFMRLNPEASNQAASADAEPAQATVISSYLADWDQKVANNNPIYKYMYLQQRELRYLLDKASKISKVTGGELFQIHEKLDAIDYAVLQRRKVIVHVPFPYNNTDFKPDQAVMNVLLPLAKNAVAVNIYGRTDSRVEDQVNKRIAVGRARSAQQYLVKHGVPNSLIQTSWLSAGDFIAPVDLEEGRQYNRRATIELVLK